MTASLFITELGDARASANGNVVLKPLEGRSGLRLYDALQRSAFVFCGFQADGRNVISLLLQLVHFFVKYTVLRLISLAQHQIAVIDKTSKVTHGELTLL